MLWIKVMGTLFSDIYLSHNSHSKNIHLLNTLNECIWMNLYSLTLCWRFINPSRNFVFYSSDHLFLNLIIYFYSVTLVCIFSPSQFHIGRPYIGSTQSALVGILTPQKNANATNQRFSSSVEPVVNNHNTTPSIPNIFKCTCLLHLLRVVFNWVGFRTRARFFKKRQLCVFWKSSHANLMLYTYISSVSLKHPPNPILSFLYWHMVWK